MASRRREADDRAWRQRQAEERAVIAQDVAHRAERRAFEQQLADRLADRSVRDVPPRADRLARPGPRAAQAEEPWTERMRRLGITGTAEPARAPSPASGFARRQDRDRNRDDQQR